MFKKPDFLGAVTITVACLGVAILGAYLAFGVSEYRSAR